VLRRLTQNKNMRSVLPALLLLLVQGCARLVFASPAFLVDFSEHAVLSPVIGIWAPDYYYGDTLYSTNTSSCTPSPATPVCVQCAAPFLGSASASGTVALTASCWLNTRGFTSAPQTVVLAALYIDAMQCGNATSNVTFSYSIGCGLPNIYRQPYYDGKDLIIMQVLPQDFLQSNNASFALCISNQLTYTSTVLFGSADGNSTSGPVHCVPHTQSPTPPTTSVPTPPTTIAPSHRPTHLPTFAPTTPSMNALAVDFYGVPAPLVYPLRSWDPVNSLVYGAYETTLQTCQLSEATPACVACANPSFVNFTDGSERLYAFVAWNF